MKRLVVGLLLLLGTLTGISAVAEERPCPPQILADDGSVVADSGQTCPEAAPVAPTTDPSAYVDPVAGVTVGARNVVNAASSAALTAALDAADCGDTIQLGAGTYTGTFNVDLSCPANNPLILKGAASFASTINGTVVMTGARNIVTGINFSGGNAGADVYGVNNKFIGNKISGWTATRAITTGGSVGQTQQEIAYNEIGPPGPASAGEFRWGLKANTNGSSDTVPTNVWVHHNLLRDFPDSGGNNDAMEPGESSYPFAPFFSAGWYIEENLFSGMKDCGQATIDMKLGGSVMRRNTIVNSCNVKIQSRFGSYAIWESNYITDGQIMMNGRGHKVVCNTITGGSGIRVNAGEAEWDFTGKDENGKNPHNRSYEVLVAKNIGPLFVGYQPDSRYSLAARDTTIEQHSGSISFGLQENTRDNRNSPSNYACAPAVQLNSSQVGPVALSSASFAYKAARGL
jgi:hypothetical protein